MKKYIWLALLLCLVNSGFSQGSDKRLRLGLTVSPGLGWMKPDYEQVENNGVRLSYLFGINVDYQLLENYFLSTGFFFNGLNGDLRYNDAAIPFIADDQTLLFNSGVSVKYNLKYIEVPIGMKLKTNEIGYFTYMARFGINTLYNTKSIGSANQLSLEDADISDEVNFFNLGYHFGLGLEYALSNHFILYGGLTYKQLFTDVTTNIDNRVKDKTNFTNVSLDLGVFF